MTATLARSVPRQGGRAPSRPLDEQRLVRELQDHYDLGRWQSWRRTDSGKSNDSYFLRTDRGRYVVRRSSEVKTPPAARFECALLDHLVAHGYPAPSVVRSRGGSCVVDLDGLVHMVMDRLPGAPYGDDASDLPLAARALARYHRLVRSLPVAVTAEEVSSPAALRRGHGRLSEAVGVVAPLLDRATRHELAAEVTYLHAETLRVAAAFQPAAALTYLITHGSYGRTAVLLDSDRLSGVVDFDRAVHDFLVLDLAYALKSFCRPLGRTADGAPVDLGAAALFLQHYDAELPLTPEDAAALPWALRLHRLAVVVKKSGNVLGKHAVLPREPDDALHFAQLVIREGARLRWLSEHHDDLGRRRSFAPSPSHSLIRPEEP